MARGRGQIRHSDLVQLGYNTARIPGDPTGIMTTQALRYNVGKNQQASRRTVRTAWAQLGMGRKKRLEDLRIKTFLGQLGKRAYQTAAGGRSRMGDAIGRQGGGRPNAAGQQRSILQDLYEQFQGAHDKANKANEDRYAQLIGGLEERRERGLGYLDQVGGQMRKDTIHQYRNMASDAGQRMVDAGLSGGSAAQVMQMGVGREKGAALNRLSEGLAMQRFNADMGLDMDRLQAIERREDVGPDYGMLAQLAQQIGSSQPQVGGGVYGGQQQGLNFGAPQFAAASQAPIANIGVRRGGYPQQMGGYQQQGQQLSRQSGVPFTSTEQAWGNAYNVGPQNPLGGIGDWLFNRRHAAYWNNQSASAKSGASQSSW